MDLFISPNFTKILAIYQRVNETYEMTLKHIDYQQNSAINLNFNHSQEFIQTYYDINKLKEL